MAGANNNSDDDDSTKSRFRSTSTVYRFIRSTVTVTQSSTATGNAAAAGSPTTAEGVAATLTEGDTARPTSPGSSPGSAVNSIPTATSFTNTASIRSAPTSSPSQAAANEGSKVLQPGIIIAIIMGILFFITIILVLWVFGQRYHFPGHRWKKIGKATYHRSGRTISSFEPKIYLPNGYDFTGGGDVTKYQPWGPAEYRRRSAGSISLPSFNLEVHEGSGPTSPAISPLDIPPFTDVSTSESPPRIQRPPPSAPVTGVGTDPIQTLQPVARRTSLPSDTASARSLPSVNEPRLVV